MIELETRKKLKGLNLFKNLCDCYYEDNGKSGSFRKRYLPNPTIEELIEAIKRKHTHWIMAPGSDMGWIVEFSKPPFGLNKRFIADDIKQALAEALIWLYEEEK